MPTQKKERKTTYFWGARWEVPQYVRSLRRAGTPVSVRIVIAAAEIVKATDCTMLTDNSGDIELTLAWAYSFLKRMGSVQQKVTTKTKASLSKSKFELVKKAHTLSATREWS